MTDRTCEAFRERALEDVLEPGAAFEGAAHPAGCEACARWMRSVRTQVEWLTALPRRRPPEHLEAGLRDALEAPPSVELVRRLGPLRAPAELEGLVAARLHEPELAEPAAWTGTLGELTPEPTPSVLDRLVEEELADPAAHRVERFVGNLERESAPPELTLRVMRLLRRRRVPIAAGLGSLAAACFLLWMTLVGRSPQVPVERHAWTDTARNASDGAPVRRLRVVRVADGQGISPLAAGLAAALNGGSPGSSNVGAHRAGEEQG